MMLTRKQLECYRVIERYQKQNDGISPSYGEMCGLLGLNSKSGIHRLILGLESRGALVRVPNASRAIRLVPLDKVMNVPSEATSKQGKDK